MSLNHASPALVDYHKAKRLHWDPRDLDFQDDQRDWASLTPLEHDGMMHLATLFLMGEEAVTHDLAPLLVALRRRGGRVEDEMFLTTQLYEEAKHLEFFDRWLTEIVQTPIATASYTTPSYAMLFYEELPARLEACLHDQSPLTIAGASVCYHMLIEGVMAETGYYSFSRCIRNRGLFPGLLKGIQLVQRDEARHIAFGLHLIASLIREAPEIWPTLVERLNGGLMLCTGALMEAFARYGSEIPFGLDLDDTVQYAMRQFSKRYGALERLAMTGEWQAQEATG